MLETGVGSFWTLTQPATPEKAIEIKMRRYMGIPLLCEAIIGMQDILDRFQ